MNPLTYGVCETVFSSNSKGKTHVCFDSAGCVKGECTIERVALVMNIVPCRDFNLRGLASYSQSYDSTLDIALIKMMCFFLIIR